MKGYWAQVYNFGGLILSDGFLSRGLKPLALIPGPETLSPQSRTDTLHPKP